MVTARKVSLSLFAYCTNDRPAPPQSLPNKKEAGVYQAEVREKSLFANLPYHIPLAGHGQGLNARDNGLNVIVGVREGGDSWKMAQEDGWVRFAFSLNFFPSWNKRADVVQS